MMNNNNKKSVGSLDSEDLAEAYQDEAEWAERIQASTEPEVIIQQKVENEQP